MWYGTVDSPTQIDIIGLLSHRSPTSRPIFTNKRVGRCKIWLTLILQLKIKCGLSGPAYWRREPWTTTITSSKWHVGCTNQMNQALEYRQHLGALLFRAGELAEAATLLEQVVEGPVDDRHRSYWIVLSCDVPRTTWKPQRGERVAHPGQRGRRSGNGQIQMWHEPQAHPSIAAR